ncbi:hypothetical protein R1flu_029055 [Riccia fluitans]|uniref:Uncharacterized protein n=1 Tax=Riccia fluitans TaxID=41844 RepID=A0ABD1XNJ0_9MARC
MTRPAMEGERNRQTLNMKRHRSDEAGHNVRGKGWRAVNARTFAEAASDTSAGGGGQKRERRSKGSSRIDNVAETTK